MTVTNEPPTAEAGPDQIVPGNYVTLDGRSSADADGQGCELEEDENGAKIIDGPLVVQDEGLLIIR